MKSSTIHRRLLLVGTLLVGLIFWESCDPDDDNPGPCQGKLSRDFLDTSITEYFPYKGGEKLVYQLITPSDTDTFSFVVQPINHFYDTQFVDNSNFGEPETCDTVVYEHLNTVALDTRKNVSLEIEADELGIHFGRFDIHAIVYPKLLNGESLQTYRLIETLQFNNMPFSRVMAREKCDNLPPDELEYYNGDIGIISTCFNGNDGFELLKLIEYEK